MALQNRPVAQQIGYNGCAHRPDGNRPSCAWPKSDQDSGRQTRGGPKYRNAIRFSQQRKAQSRGQKIGNTHGDGKPARPHPLSARCDDHRQLSFDLLL